MNTPSVALRCGVLAAVLIGAGYAMSDRWTARAAGAPLLSPVDGQIAGADAQAVSDPTVRRSRYTTINFDVLPGPSDRRMLREPSISLELFPDVTIYAAFDRYDPNADGVTWVGHVEGLPMSTVTLVYSNGLMTGSIVTPTALYQIRPASAAARAAADAGGQLHVVSQIDQGAFLPEADPVEPTFTDAERAAAAEMPMADSADFIDVMVVYTPLAAAHAGGQTAIANLINLGISETNTSYANSGVNQRLRLVRTAQVNYVETGNFSQALAELRTGGTVSLGPLAGVAAMRNASGADMVKMLIHPTSPSACGIAFIMTSVSNIFESAAFSVTDTGCVSPNYTFAHELGHNMGARHDWYMDAGTTPFSFAHGHVNPTVGQRWRTIMAYPDMCTALGFSCTRLLHWANPEKRYNPFCDRGFNCNQLQYWYFPGPPMGIAGGTSTSCVAGNPNNANCDADDRRALNNTAVVVANFRQSLQGDRR